MTTQKPKVNRSDRYPIGKAAEILGISRSTLLRHTKSEDINCSFARSSHRKIYTGEEIINYWMQMG